MLRVPSHQNVKSRDDNLSHYDSEHMPQMGGLIKIGNESRLDENESLASSVVRFNIAGVEISPRHEMPSKPREREEFDIDLNRFEAFKHYGESQRQSRLTGTFGDRTSKGVVRDNITNENSARVARQTNQIGQDSLLNALDQSKYSSVQNNSQIHVNYFSNEDIDRDFQNLKEGNGRNSNFEKTTWEALKDSIGNLWTDPNPKEEKLAFRPPPGRQSRVIPNTEAQQSKVGERMT